MADDFESIIEGAQARKNKDASKKAYEYYEVDKTKAEEEVKKSIPQEIGDLISKLGKPMRAAFGGVHEAVRQQSSVWEFHADELNVDEIIKETKKGWDLKTDKSLRDIARLVNPEFISELEKNGTKIWGIDVDLGTPFFAVGTIAFDPINWIPFGFVGRLAKGAFSIFGKTAEIAAGAVIGTSRVAKIVDNASEAWLKTGARVFNSRQIWNAHRELGDAFDRFKDVTPKAEYLAGKATQEAVKVDKNGFFRWLTTYARKADRESIGKVLHEASDDIEGALGNRYQETLKKELGTMFPKVPEYKLGELNESVFTGAPTTKLINDLVRYEYKASKAGAIVRYRGARQIFKETSNKIGSEIDAIQAAKKGELKISYDIMKSSVDRSITAVKGLQKAIKNSGQVTDAQLVEIVNGLKEHIKDLGRYQMDWSGVLKKGARSLERYKDIQSKMQDLIAASSRSAIEGTRFAGKEVIEQIDNLAKDIRMFGKLQSVELSGIGKALKFNKGLNNQIESKFSEKLVELTDKKANIEKWFREESVFFEGSKRVLKKEADKTFNTYNKQVGEIVAGGLKQKVMQGFAVERAEILAKHLSELPKEMQPVAYNVVNFFDEWKSKLIKEGIFKGDLPAFYFPRKMTKESLDEVFAGAYKVPSGGGGGSFRYQRHFKTAKEFSEYAASQGGKVENDVAAVMFDYAKSGEMLLAKNSLHKEVFSRLGVEDMDGLRKRFPQMAKQLDYLFNNKLFDVNNSVLEMGFKAYGTMLNAMKIGLTVINPMFIGRNILGMPFLASTTAGFKNGMNVFNYSTAFMIKNGMEGKLGKYSYEAIRNAIEESGYFATSWTRGATKESLKMMLGDYNFFNPMDIVKYPFAKIFHLNSYIEDLGRSGALVANLRSGKTLEEALVAGKKAMFDYNLSNSPADKVLQSIFGFYVWPRRNLPMQIATLFNDPKQYEIVRQILDKVSLREKVTDEEMDAIKDYDRTTLKWFGKVVDGVREYYTLGFHPMEQAYQTWNTVTNGDWRKGLASQVNPVLGAMMDFYYSKDSFYGKDFGYSLPSKYTELMPEKYWKIAGFTLKEKPKYKAGEVVGTEKVLYGDPDTISVIRRFPIGGRFISELAEYLKAKHEQKGKPGLLKYLSGIRRGEADIEASKFARGRQAEDIMMKEAQKKGAPVFKKIFIPKNEKEAAKAKRRGD